MDGTWKFNPFWLPKDYGYSKPSFPGKAGGDADGFFFFCWVLFSWMRGEWARQDGDVMSGFPQLANFYCASVTIMMKLN